MKHIVVGTAGHIDHGKSALVRALTGTDPDRLKEEQARGITIDLGFAYWTAANLHVAFVDVPGHERFVKNMLAGVGGIDAVLFVVAADESVMPQTREHFEICRLLQVPAGIVVLTKADLVDQDTLDLVTLEVRDLVAGSFLEAAPVVPVSSKTGSGLDVLQAALVDLGTRCPGRDAGGAVRLPIDRVFSVKGFGTVVTGTLVSGTIAADTDLVVLPGERPVKVRGVQVHGASQASARAGQRAAVNLGGVDVADLVRGDTVVSPGQYMVSRVCDARLDLLGSAKPLRHGARVRVHQGTSEVLGRVALSSVVGDAEGAITRGEIEPGRTAHVRIRLEAPIVMTRGDRFILRAYSPSVTIAGGAVLDPAPPRIGIRTAAGRQRFADLDPAAPAASGIDPDERAVELLLTEAAIAGVAVASLVARMGIEPAASGRLVERLTASGRALRVEGVLVSAAAVGTHVAQLLAQLGDHHRQRPLEEGMPREEARERAFPHAAPGLFDRVVNDLAAARRIIARDRLALASHRLDLSEEEQQGRDRIETCYRDAGLKPPDLKEASTTLGIAVGVAERMASLLARQRVLVKVDAFLFHESALAGLKQDMGKLKADAPAGVPAKIDVGSFKERYGVSRKYAIPLLEYLDRERVTRRVGDTRVVI